MVCFRDGVRNFGVLGVMGSEFHVSSTRHTLFEAWEQKLGSPTVPLGAGCGSAAR